MHLKRQQIPKTWPLPRKGTTYVVRPSFSIEKGIPLLVVLRDILKIVHDRKEAKKAIHAKNILLNNLAVMNEKSNVLLFDTIKIIPSEKFYRMELSEKRKFEIREISKNEANKKISKIINKKILNGKKTQLNLNDGRNFISDIKCKVNDSVLIDFDKKKIEKILPLKEKAKVIIFEGKHSGKTGIINSINSEKKMTELSVNEEKINVLIRQIIVVE